MYLCYIDESGTPQVPGNSTHYVLAGLAIPIWHWTKCDVEIRKIKKKYNLQDKEVHTAWILRGYPEQGEIESFEEMSQQERRTQVLRLRHQTILRLQRAGNPKHHKQTKKNFKKTDDYIHLTKQERIAFITELADMISEWGFARLFAECVDKLHFDPNKASRPIDEQAFEQVVSRFSQYLQITEKNDGGNNHNYGLLIHDNNDTVARRHTKLMSMFHSNGTFWTSVNKIIETPLFVGSSLTGLVQIADLCSYSIRRYLQNNETDLFDRVFKRVDRKNGIAVGMRHFTRPDCNCKICESHKTAR